MKDAKACAKTLLILFVLAGANFYENDKKRFNGFDEKEASRTQRLFMPVLSSALGPLINRAPILWTTKHTGIQYTRFVII